MEQNTKEFVYYYLSDIGKMTLTSDGENITGLWLEGQKYYGDIMAVNSPERNNKEEMLPVFKQAKRWLDMYFSGKEPDFSLPLAPKGSPFRQKVWKMLCDIWRYCKGSGERIRKGENVCTGCGGSRGAQPDFCHDSLSPCGRCGWQSYGVCRRNPQQGKAAGTGAC